MLYRNSQNKKPHSLTSRIDKILKMLAEIKTSEAWLVDIHKEKFSTSDLESDLKEVSNRTIEMAADIKTIKDMRLK